MHLKTKLTLLVSALFFISCTHNDVVQYDVHPKSPMPFVTYTNVIYGNADTSEQMMDVFLPTGKGKKNGIVIFIHGGGWSSGEKDDFNGLGIDTFLTANGLAMATINYRLAGQYDFPACLDDIGLAIGYIKSKASDWNIDTSRICLFGRSSGAHLALLYAYTHNESGNIRSVIDMFGPTDLTDSAIRLHSLNINVTLMLGAYMANAMLWHDASPIFYMNKAIPTLVMQGTTDTIVFPIESERLQDSLIAHNIPSEYIPWQGNGHGWNQARWRENRDVTLAFILHYMNR